MQGRARAHGRLALGPARHLYPFGLKPRHMEKTLASCTAVAATRPQEVGTPSPTLQTTASCVRPPGSGLHPWGPSDSGRGFMERTAATDRLAGSWGRAVAHGEPGDLQSAGPRSPRQQPRGTGSAVVMLDAAGPPGMRPRAERPGNGPTAGPLVAAPTCAEPLACPVQGQELTGALASPLCPGSSPACTLMSPRALVVADVAQAASHCEKSERTRLCAPGKPAAHGPWGPAPMEPARPTRGNAERRAQARRAPPYRFGEAVGSVAGFEDRGSAAPGLP